MHFLISILKILLSIIIEKQIFCYQFPKQKKIYYYIFRRLIPFSGIRRLFYYHKGGFYYYDRYRKGTLAGPAPIGGSPGAEPSERAKGTNPQAHSDRGNSGKGAARGADDGAADIGGLSITKNTTEKLKRSEGLRATGDLLPFPEGRTYSPPRRRKVRLPPFPPLAKTAATPLLLLSPQSRLCGAPFPAVVLLLRISRALSEGDAAPAGAYGQCRTSAEVSSLSTQGTAVSLWKQLRPCLRKPATGSFAAEMDGAPAPSIFSFAKEKQKRERGDTIWQSTIWRQRWSVVGLAAPLPQRRPI